jgi:hypothetical protein
MINYFIIYLLEKNLKNLLEGTKPITNNIRSTTQGGGFYFME